MSTTKLEDAPTTMDRWYTRNTWKHDSRRGQQKRQRLLTHSPTWKQGHFNFFIKSNPWSTGELASHFAPAAP